MLALCAVLAGCAAPRRAEGEYASSDPVEPVPEEAAASKVNATPDVAAAGDAVPASQEPAPSGAAEPPAAQLAPGDAQETVVETAAASEEPAAASAAPAAAPQPIHGSIALRYRGRATDDDQDHQLRALLTLDYDDPSAPRVSGHVQARADADLDGHEDGGVFGGLSDTYDHSVVGKLYLAYADVALGEDPARGPGTLRIGRQSDPRLPEVLRLDGLSYLSRPMGTKELELGLYAGVPARLYESSTSGDQAYGTFVEGRPWARGRARFDWMHLEDDVLLGEGRDDLLALGLWHTLTQHTRLEGEFSHLESDPRDVRLRVLYEDPGTEGLVRFTYYELLETQKFRVQELDPFTEELLEYFPYRQGSLNVSRAFGAHAVLDLGFDLRRVSDADDVGEFNREWERYYATATWRDAFAEGLSLSLTGDRWDDEDQDTSALGADLSYNHEGWRTALGTYYSLYKYELLQLSERDDVRTYYVTTTRELSERLRFELAYEFEDDDLETYHTVRLGGLWRF